MVVVDWEREGGWVGVDDSRNLTRCGTASGPSEQTLKCNCSNLDPFPNSRPSKNLSIDRASISVFEVRDKALREDSGEETVEVREVIISGLERAMELLLR